MEDEKAGVAEAGMAGQPEHICQLARLIEAGGRPELDLALVGCAGGRVCRGLWAAAFHLAGVQVGLQRKEVVRDGDEQRHHARVCEVLDDGVRVLVHERHGQAVERLEVHQFATIVIA